LLGGAGLKTPTRTKILSFSLFFFVLAGCMLQAACGNSSGSKTPMTVTSSETPAGIYTVTVTGNSNGMQHATTVSLTVQ
jgi:hypothetical protein